MRYLLRYISILFIIFLSNVSFSQQNWPPLDPAQGCALKNSYSGGPAFTSTYNNYLSNCTASASINLIQQITYTGGSGSTIKALRCYSCADPCPAPSVFDAVTKKCTQQFCPDGSPMPLEGCLGDEGGGDESCPSGYPKVNGQCPICPEYNSDGTCANPSSEPASSAPNSSSPNSASAASNASAASTPSGGDDDGNDTPGGGGSGGGSGGNNGGSAASASSASGTGTSSGTNNSWNPYSGYGNWIPIAPDSPCPNKYQDVSGQWWCAGNGIGSGSASSAGSNGSNGSNSSGSAGSNSSGSSASSSCPAKPQCKKNTGIEADDNACKKLLQEYFSACPGNPTENGLFDIDKDELGEGRPLTFKNSLEDFKTSMTDSENVQAINEFFSFEGSGTCPVWQVQAMGFNIVIDQQCSPNIPWDLIRGMIIAVSILLAARIALH